MTETLDSTSGTPKKKTTKYKWYLTEEERVLESPGRKPKARRTCGPAARKNRPPVETITSYEAARRLGVKAETVKTWAAKGFLVRWYQTLGGHYRYCAEEVERFKKKYGIGFPEEANKSQPHVLLINQDEDTEKTIKKALGEHKYVFLAARNALQAGMQMHKRPDLIVTELYGLDGLILCKELKDNPDTRGIPLIALTELHDEESIDKVYGAGVDAYLAKPFRIDNFLHTALQLLEQGR